MIQKPSFLFGMVSNNFSLLMQVTASDQILVCISNILTTFFILKTSNSFFALTMKAMAIPSWRLGESKFLL